VAELGHCSGLDTDQSSKVSHILVFKVLGVHTVVSSCETPTIETYMWGDGLVGMRTKVS
jgi:hypothetical protein